MRHAPAATVLPVLIAVLGAAGMAVAQDGFAPADGEPPRPAVPERSELPESVLRAERQTGGEVLRAERMQRDGREVYRLKVLTPDGRVRIMRDDPRERRRDAWRDRRGDDSRDPFPTPPQAERFETQQAPAFEPRPAVVPNDLDMPETLPPVERGDGY